MPTTQNANEAMKFEISKSQFNRAVRDFTSYAKEEVNVQFYDSAYWIFGSELAVLRIADKYRQCSADIASKGYSETVKSNYFKLEVPDFIGEMSNADSKNEMATVADPAEPDESLKDDSPSFIRM